MPLSRVSKITLICLFPASSSRTRANAGIHVKSLYYMDKKKDPRVREDDADGCGVDTKKFRNIKYFTSIGGCAALIPPYGAAHEGN